jgi:hypothetical protein
VTARIYIYIRKEEGKAVFFPFKRQYAQAIDLRTYLISVFLTSDASVNTITGMAKFRKQFL